MWKKAVGIVGLLIGMGWSQYVYNEGEFLQNIGPIRKIALSPTFETDSLIAVAGEDGWMIAKLPEGPLKVFYTGEPVQDLILEGQHLLVLTSSSLQMFEVGYDVPYLTFSRLDSTAFGGFRLLPYTPLVSPNTQRLYALARGQDGVDLLIWDTTSNGFVVDNHLAYPAYDLARFGPYLILAAGNGGTYLIHPTPSGGEVVGSIPSSYELPNHREVVTVSHFLLIRGDETDGPPPVYPLKAFDIQDPANPHLAMVFPHFTLSPPKVAIRDSFFCVIGMALDENWFPTDSIPRLRLYRVTGGDSIVEVYNVFMDYLTDVVLLSPTKILWGDNSTVYFGKPGGSGIPWVSLPESIEWVRVVKGGVLAFDANHQLYYGNSRDWWSPPLSHRSFVKQVLRLSYIPISVATFRNSTGHFVAMLDPEGGINLYRVVQDQKILWVSRSLVFPQAYGPMTGSDSGRLYIATDGYTVTVVDLSDIENPEILGTVSFPDSIVALAGKPAFLGVGFDNGSFSVYHWQNPTSPDLVTQYAGDANLLMMDYKYVSGYYGFWQTIAALYDDSTVVTVADEWLNPIVHAFPAQPLACAVGGGYLGAAAGPHGYYLQGWGGFWYYPAHGNALDVDLGGIAQFVAMGPYGVASFSGYVNVEEQTHQMANPIRLQHTVVRSQVVLQGRLEPGVIEIFDITGRRMAQRHLPQPQNTAVFPVVSWPTGVYLLRYIGNTMSPITLKFLKIQ